MKLKTFIMAAMFIVAFFTTPNTLAQSSNTSPEALAKQSVEQLDAKLDLNDDQEKKVYEITLKYLKKGHALKNSSASKLEKYRAYNADSESKMKEMEQVLSEDQFEKWLQITEENKERMKEQQKNR